MNYHREIKKLKQLLKNTKNLKKIMLTIYSCNHKVKIYKKTKMKLGNTIRNNRLKGLNKEDKELEKELIKKEKAEQNNSKAKAKVKANTNAKENTKTKDKYNGTDKEKKDRERVSSYITFLDGMAPDLR